LNISFLQNSYKHNNYIFYNEAANIGLGGGDWELIEEGIDVSSFYHNNYNGFFALRPAYLLGGGAQLLSFEYKPL